jgi:uncharacterized membrane protein
VPRYAPAPVLANWAAMGTSSSEQKEHVFLMNMTVHLIICSVLVLVVVALFIYHHWLENHEDHYIHLHTDSHDSNIITSQTVMEKRIAALDKVKNGLLIAVIVYALAIAGMAIFNAWNTAGVS